jgi:hypothetical protein
MVDIFSHSYDPTEWDLVSTHSYGEYLSVTDTSDSEYNFDSPPNVNTLEITSDSDSTTSDVDFLSLPDIKMFTISHYSPTEIQSQISTLQLHLSSLTPGYFRLTRNFCSDISSLQQLSYITQPNMVNLEEYYPSDKYFNPKPPSSQDCYFLEHSPKFKSSKKVCSQRTKFPTPTKILC